MASVYAGPVQELIDELGRLPGVGPKSAQRIAFYLLRVPADDANRLAKAITQVKARISFCPRCFNIAEGGECAICADAERDQTVICVVEEPRDVVAIERTGEYRGRYHVLGGAIDHLEGVGPDQLKIRELLVRLGQEPVGELVIATNPNLTGEATGMYLVRLLKDVSDLTVTRLASGLPVGGDLEYADELTLGRALAGRRQLQD